MSYDLMVFEPAKAPAARKEFMAWYEKQTEGRTRLPNDWGVFTRPAKLVSGDEGHIPAHEWGICA